MNLFTDISDSKKLIFQENQGAHNLKQFNKFIIEDWAPAQEFDDQLNNSKKKKGKRMTKIDESDCENNS